MPGGAVRDGLSAGGAQVTSNQVQSPVSKRSSTVEEIAHLPGLPATKASGRVRPSGTCRVSSQYGSQPSSATCRRRNAWPCTCSGCGAGVWFLTVMTTGVPRFTRRSGAAPAEPAAPLIVQTLCGSPV